MNKKLFIPLLLLLAVVSSCRKDVTTELDGDWLFPIAKGDFSLNSLSQLRNLKYNIQVPAFSLGQPENVPVSSPGLQLKHVGPFPVLITDWLHRLDVDSLEFSGSLNNFFPIPIGAGTKVVMRTTRDTISAANIAGTAVIPADVPPGEIFSFNIQVINKTLNDSVFFFLEDFNSPAYNNVVFTSNPSQLNIKLKVLTANFVEIYTQRVFSSIDTLEFSPGKESDLGPVTGGVINDTTASGIIHVFADNGMPATAVSQLYFLDETKTIVLDSLFIPYFSIAGGTTDAAGNPVNVAATTEDVVVSKAKITNIRKSAFVVNRFTFNTSGYPGPYVAANRSAVISIQLTGDLNLRIRF